jgi:hypothetical protein
VAGVAGKGAVVVVLRSSILILSIFEGFLERAEAVVFLVGGSSVLILVLVLLSADFRFLVSGGVVMVAGCAWSRQAGTRPGSRCLRGAGGRSGCSG